MLQSGRCREQSVLSFFLVIFHCYFTVGVLPPLPATHNHGRGRGATRRFFGNVQNGINECELVTLFQEFKSDNDSDKERE